MSANPIAYTYEADTHCPPCTRARFGPSCEGTDSEGNAVGAIFPWDEWHEAVETTDVVRFTLSCGTCGGAMDECVHGEHPAPPPCECDSCVANKAVQA